MNRARPMAARLKKLRVNHELRSAHGRAVNNKPRVDYEHQGHAPNVILKLSGKNTRSIKGKFVVSKTPANRSHQSRRLWRKAGKCSEGHAQ